MNRPKNFVRALLLQLVAVVMLLGNLHVCSQILHHARGPACTDGHQSVSGISAHPPDHRHEHECELRPCHDQVAKIALLASAQRDLPSDSAILPVEPVSPQAPELGDSASLVWLIATSPPTGPPLSRTCRAPPFFLQPA